jgi:hypothetical protein
MYELGRGKARAPSKNPTVCRLHCGRPGAMRARRAWRRTPSEREGDRPDPSRTCLRPAADRLQRRGARPAPRRQPLHDPWGRPTKPCQPRAFGPPKSEAGKRGVHLPPPAARAFLLHPDRFADPNPDARARPARARRTYGAPGFCRDPGPRTRQPFLSRSGVR